MTWQGFLNGLWIAFFILGCLLAGISSSNNDRSRR